MYISRISHPYNNLKFKDLHANTINMILSPILILIENIMPPAGNTTIMHTSVHQVPAQQFIKNIKYI